MKQTKQKAKEVEKKQQQKAKANLPKFLVEQKPTKNLGEIVGTTQTQTFETKFLRVLVESLNEKKGLSLEIPTIKLKGTKKQLFKYCFFFLFQSLGYNPTQIENFLREGKYIK